MKCVLYMKIDRREIFFFFLNKKEKIARQVELFGILI